MFCFVRILCILPCSLLGDGLGFITVVYLRGLDMGIQD